jgi:DNA-binding MarR family transcriptional regulator
MALASLAGRDKAQVTRIIAELEALGLISRLRSTTDRRSTQLSLTESGETLFRRVLVKRGNLTSAMLNALDAEERNALHAMLVKMRSSLADAEQ